MITYSENIEEKLHELEKTQKNYWNIARETANFLSILIKTANSKNVLEIGTSNGYSAIWLALALKETNGHLTTIEYWEKRQSIARENFKICGVDSLITPIIGSAFDVMEEMLKNGQKFDFIFMDANKEEYIGYFEYADKMLEKGGIITADNVLSHELKVKPFVDEIMSRPDYQTEILNLPAGLLLARKSL